LGRLEEAEMSYKQAISCNSHFAEAYSNLGIVFQNMDRLGDAEESCRKAIALNPNFAEAFYNLGNILKELGNLNNAEESFKKAIALNQDYTDAYINLGNTLKDMRRWEEAEESYIEAVSLNPDLAEAHYNLGVIQILLNRLKEAESAFTVAILRDPNNPKAHYNLGKLLCRFGRGDEAEHSFRKTIELDANFIEAHSSLGVILGKMDRFEEAEDCFQQAVTLGPDLAENYVNLGGVQQEMNRLTEALENYEHAIYLQPDLAEAHNNKGVVLKELERFGEAESSYLKAVTLEPDYALAYSNLGVVQYINGESDSSLEFLKKADKLDPSLHSNKIIMTLLSARNMVGKVESDSDGLGGFNYNQKSLQFPLFLDREVEAELISSLYEMKSIELDKFDNGRSFDPRFGMGQCSRDFHLFNHDSVIIKSVEQDLTRIVKDIFKSDVLITESFFNILGAGGGTIPHAHLSKLDKDKHFYFGEQKFSLVYYLSVGDQNSSDPGILKLYNPSQDILPHDGMVAVFPAGRKHSSAYDGKEDRIMIGVNFYCF
jgi:tetratricopeptide (TPR) repeat protein